MLEMLPNELLLIIFDKYPLKYSRLICKNINTLTVNKYFNNMIDINALEIKNYLKSEHIKEILSKMDIMVEYRKLKTKYISEVEIRSQLKDITTKFIVSQIDLMTQYKILKYRITWLVSTITFYNNEKYITDITKNKLIQILRQRQLDIYCDNSGYLTSIYKWLYTNNQMMNLFNNNYINDDDSIDKIRSEAKQLYNNIVNHIKQLKYHDYSLPITTIGYTSTIKNFYINYKK